MKYASYELGTQRNTLAEQSVLIASKKLVGAVEAEDATATN
jgi:hypothetical protein